MKLTSQAVTLLLLCSASALIGLCVTTMILRRRASGKKNQGINGLTQTKWAEPSCNWATVRDSVRWSGANRWEESQRPSQSPLLGHGLGILEAGVGWRSRNSISPVWQRPILMGEKCEFPRFSGLILYDERGRLLRQSFQGDNHQEEKPQTMVPKTTLRELLL